MPETPAEGKPRPGRLAACMVLAIAAVPLAQAYAGPPACAMSDRACYRRTHPGGPPLPWVSHEQPGQPPVCLAEAASCQMPMLRRRRPFSP